MTQAFIMFILEHLAQFSGQNPFFCFDGLFERKRLTTFSLYTLHLVLIMRVSSIDGISQQYDQFSLGYNRRSSSGGVRMKQVVRAGLSRDVLTAVTHLQRKMRAVPIGAFCEVEIEIVHFFREGWLHMRMLHQELMKKRSAALLRSDNDKVWQHSYWSSSHSPKMPGNVSFFAASLHNSRFVLQARTYYKPKEEGTHLHRTMAILHRGSG